MVVRKKLRNEVSALDKRINELEDCVKSLEEKVINYEKTLIKAIDICNIQTERLKAEDQKRKKQLEFLTKVDR